MASNPTLLTQPIATNGTKNAIPNTTTTPGKMSQDQGFPSETSMPLGAGGVAPSREDFNGAFNLLSALLYYAQKGFTFNYDNTQNYYTGCIVIDPSDGLRYECIVDMAAGTVAPHDDSTNTYWQIFKSGLEADQIPAFNKRDVIITSGSYTAPVTGWYKITVKGGGGGGGGGNSTVSQGTGGAGGGEGGTSIGFEHMTAGQNATVIIGAGGSGGAAGAGTGSDGGDSTVTVNANTYTGGGGGGAGNMNAIGNATSGKGGTGTIVGESGGSTIVSYNSAMTGAQGGGAGGAVSVLLSGVPADGVNGGGGAGGSGTYNNGGSYAGSAGGDGFAWFEYFDASLNP